MSSIQNIELELNNLDESIIPVSKEKLFKRGNISVDFSIYKKGNYNSFINIFIFERDTNFNEIDRKNLEQLITYLIEKKSKVFIIYDNENEDLSILFNEIIQIISPYYFCSRFKAIEDKIYVKLYEGWIKLSVYLESHFNGDTFFIGPKTGKTKLGIECIIDNCWNCKKEMYSITGVVIPNKKVNNWKTDNWKYYNSPISTEYLDTNIIEQINIIIEKENKNNNTLFTPIKFNYSNTRKGSYWSATCPYCDKIRGQFHLSNHRMRFMHDYYESIENNKIIYLDLNSELKQSMINKLFFGFDSAPTTEITQWVSKKNVLQHCI